TSLMTPRAGRRLRRNLLIYAGLAPFVVVAVFPMYWMAVTAFKEEADLYRMDLVPFWFHTAPTLKNFYILFTHSYVPVCFVKTLPREIEEAAWVDGCGLIGGVLRVVLPLTRPGIVITAIFAFTLAMQESLYAVVYVAPRDQTTVTVGVATALIRGDIYYWGSL